MLTMVLGGLWHGAAWTFVIWGTLHGLYLVVNHLWRAAAHAGHAVERETIFGRGTARLITFLAVVGGWVFFRAASFTDALAILRGMAGQNGVSLPAGIAAHLGFVQGVLQGWGVAFSLGGGSRFLLQYAWIACCRSCCSPQYAAAAWALPAGARFSRRLMINAPPVAALARGDSSPC
jgi:hypothetical protein